MRFVLDSKKLGGFKTPVKGQRQQGRSRMVIVRHIPAYGMWFRYIPSRGLLRCSSRLDRHVERPLGVGRARKVDPTFLFLYAMTL